MKKAYIPLLAALSAVFPAAPALPAPLPPAPASGDAPAALERLEGTFFTAEAPAGEWRVREISPGTAALVSDDCSAALTVTATPSGGLSPREAAEFLAAEHGGSRSLVRLESGPGGEVWEYRGVSSRQPLYAQVFTLAGGRLGVITVIGDPDAPDTADIFNSIRFK